MTGLLCYCRQGFEPELAAELSERAAQAGHPGYARTERNSALVVFMCEEAAALSRALPWRDLIFARQKLQLLAELRGLDPKDRITPMLAALKGHTRFTPMLMMWSSGPNTTAPKGPPVPASMLMRDSSMARATLSASLAWRAPASTLSCTHAGRVRWICA